MGSGEGVSRAIILSAGKGSRLLPLTADRPKCLIELSGRTLLEWQLDSLFDAGISETIVVTGFRPDLVEATLARRGDSRGAPTTLFNPFYHVADNIGSVWMARGAMDRDCLLLNGDTLVPPALIERLAGAEPAPVSVAVDQKKSYDADDMKVLLEGKRVVRIDKGLSDWNAESIGCLRFSAAGARAFLDTIETLLRTPEGTGHFYLRAIDRLADTGVVSAVSIKGIGWAEVDYAADLDAARRLTREWAASAGAPERAEPGA